MDGFLNCGKLLDLILRNYLPKELKKDLPRLQTVLGTSRETIRFMVNGEKQITLAVIKRLAGVIGVSEVLLILKFLHYEYTVLRHPDLKQPLDVIVQFLEKEHVDSRTSGTKDSTEVDDPIGGTS
jgi:hypothetical protein